MPHVRFSTSVLRAARDSAKAACGGKPGHLSEAVASGLGFRSHAAALACLAGSPADGLERPWSPEAFSARLAEISSIDATAASRAAAAAEETLGAGPPGGMSRVADLVADIAKSGGGSLLLTEIPGGTRYGVWRRCERREGNGHLAGLDLPALCREVLDADDGRPLPKPAGRSAKGMLLHGLSMMGRLAARTAGLPRDNVPGSYSIWLDDGNHLIALLTIPPLLAVNGGVEALGREIDVGAALLAAPFGIRVVSGHPNLGKTEVLRVAAVACARSTGRDLLDLTSWAYRKDEDPEGYDEPSPIKEKACAQAIADGVEGKVVLMATARDEQDADIATRLAAMGALVWIGLDARSLDHAYRRMDMLGFEADHIPAFHVPDGWRPEAA